MNEEYRQALREFMAKKGQAADINRDADVLESLFGPKDVEDGIIL